MSKSCIDTRKRKFNTWFLLHVNTISILETQIRGNHVSRNDYFDEGKECGTIVRPYCSADNRPGKLAK